MLSPIYRLGLHLTSVETRYHVQILLVLLRYILTRTTM